MPHYVRTIESEVRQRGGNLMLKLDHGDETVFRANVLSLLTSDVHGVIVSYGGGVQATDCLYRAEHRGLPVVLIDRRLDGSELDTVSTDNLTAAGELARLLVEAGADPVVCIAAVQPFTIEPIQDRIMGYVRALASQSMQPLVVAVPSHQPDAWYAAFRDVVKTRCSGSTPGVLFTHANVMVAFWEYLVRQSEPLGRYRLAHFDETYLQHPQELCLASAVQPLEAIGRLAVDRLWERLEGLPAQGHMKLPAEIRISSAMNDAITARRNAWAPLSAMRKE